MVKSPYDGARPIKDQYINVRKMSLLQRSDFDVSKPTKILIHGYTAWQEDNCWQEDYYQIAGKLIDVVSEPFF